ncbi:GNAT family N-acetyltransferase [Streptomyces sp. TP-A0356]|uniref:GNAT family N-acetyltransferase n=1 Tax=Streptomyces sp. TP-A0356 TaxID=1359208 RepID=UPI0006E2CD6A|nr:GNAT family N-acetyltransferase [Streptomyces sp. TP-A0356]
MPPTDASTDAGTAFADPAGPDPGTGSEPEAEPGRSPDCEETLDLRLPDEFLALCAEEETDRPTWGPPGLADPVEAIAAPAAPAARHAVPQDDDLLDHLADWGSTTTPAGVLHLVPVRLARDLPLIARWMNDPAVAAFWDLAGEASVTDRHLRAQLDGDGRSVPCLGVLNGTPMSYWEIYRADLDPLARHYPARPHDTGIHLLIGGVADRGRGLGSTLLRAAADLILDRRPSCARVVAEPDLRNTPSIAAFLSAGFRFSAEVDLPHKRAALMVRDRVLRHLLPGHHSE